MKTVYLSLGSNVGHRLNYLRRAFEQLLEMKILTEAIPSVVIETPALLPENAPKEWNHPHLNTVVRGTTKLEPEEILKSVKAIEFALGRSVNHSHWGPRTIDIDILLYEGVKIHTPILTLPHPELKHRWFFLHLLASLSPNLNDSESGKTFQELAQQQMKDCGATIEHSFALYPQLVGVVNVTPDSFSDGGFYFSPDKAIQHGRQLIQEGASILDIGAQSTRPGAVQLSTEEEWQRLKPVLDGLDLKQIPVSIDTYRNDLILKLLEHYPLAWVNDVSGRLNETTLKAVAQADCKLCTMHSLSVPPKPGEYCVHLWETLENWCKTLIDKLIAYGFKPEKIILDPGIGFGKTAYQTGLLLQSIQRLKQWGCKILVGHSRKSFFNLWSTLEAQQRDIETLAVSQYLQDKVEYLRVHNVAWHQRFFSIQQWLLSTYENSND